MNITYLIGNGFDLHLGMNTSPKAFLSHFVEQNKFAADPHAKNLAQTIAMEGIDTWADFEMGIGRHSRHFSDTGSDVEEYLSEVESLERSLADWLRAEDKKITDDVLDEKTSGIISAFADVERLLARDGVYVNNGTGDEEVINFLCFNYTSAFVRALSASARNGIWDNSGHRHELGSIVFPHGTLGSLLVCGVDGPDQIANASWRSNEDIAASVVKETIQRDDNFSFDIDAMDVIDRSDIICVFGMSLGQSDRRWWRRIAYSLMNKSLPLNQLVIFSHEMNGTDLSVPPARRRAKSTVRNLFLTSAEVDEDVRKRVVSSIQAYPTKLLLPDSS